MQSQGKLFSSLLELKGLVQCQGKWLTSLFELKGLVQCQGKWIQFTARENMSDYLLVQESLDKPEKTSFMLGQKDSVLCQMKSVQCSISPTDPVACQANRHHSLVGLVLCSIRPKGYMFHLAKRVICFIWLKGLYVPFGQKSYMFHQD